MQLQDELLNLERGFWQGSADFYRGHVDEKCLVAFTKMAQVMDRAQVADTVEEGPRWTKVDLEPKGLIEPAPGVAVLTYAASAEKDGQHYSALVSSGYVERDGDWKLVFHQQTPLAGKASA